MKLDHRRTRDHSRQVDMGAVLGATPVQGCVGFPLCDELEPVRQRVGRSQLQTHSVRGNTAIFGEVRPLQIVR